MYKGAGILIVESYKNSPVITLFGKHNSELNDVGGSIDPNESSEVAAARECREETGNLINIKPSELLQISMPVLLRQYISYAVYVRNISAKDYNHNIKQIFGSCNSHVWKETNIMARFPLKDIIAAANSYSKTAIDVNNKQYLIRDRTMGLIRAAVPTLNKIIRSTPIELVKNRTSNSRMSCLIGTYTYTLQSTKLVKVNNLQLPLDKKYGIYIVPNLDKTKLSTSAYTFLNNCGTWGGLHTTLCGFSNKIMYQNIKLFLDHVSKSGKKMWKINNSTIKIQNQTIFYKSRTLDIIADFLYNNCGFTKVKGKKYSGVKWHFSIEKTCTIPQDIKAILANLTFSFVIVEINNSKELKWLDHYNVTMH
jgi:hypothetical protein